ncbi:hypothetical protein AB1Y20_019610 [Prymnesium parvum]|uniref:Uncharacterized protein n=1 Tax=Prymnesium parvum TaxID=97485 RepID=A0AB34JUX3_PRYPA
MGKNKDLKQRVRRNATAAELEQRRLKREAVQAERKRALLRQQHSEKLQAVHRLFNMPRDSREAGPGGGGGGEQDVGDDEDELGALSELPWSHDDQAEVVLTEGVVGQQSEAELHQSSRDAEQQQEPSRAGEGAPSGENEHPADAEEDGAADAEIIQDMASWFKRDVGAEDPAVVESNEWNDFMQWEEAADNFLLDESDWNDSMGNDDDDDAGDDDDPAAGEPTTTPECGRAVCARLRPVRGQ